MVKKTDFNSTVTEIEGKIPSISGLATKSAIAVVENKILDVSGFVKKTGYNKLITKVNNIDTTDFAKKKKMLVLQILLQLKMTISLMQH